MLISQFNEEVKDQLEDIDIEEIASALYLELDSLDVEELWDRSGRTRHGYVEPNEMASEMIDEVLEPFLENLKRYNQLSFRAQAKSMCMGIIKGLYQFEQESQNDFVDWAVDMPGECAVLVLKEWNTSDQTTEDLLEMEQFIKQSLPSWHRFLARVVMPKRKK